MKELRRTTQPRFYDEAPAFIVTDRLERARTYHQNRMASKANEAVPVNLVRDVASLAIGGKMLDMEEFLASVQAASEGADEVMMHEFLRTQLAAYGFVSNVDLTNVAGRTPTEKAANYIVAAMLQSQQPGKSAGDMFDNDQQTGKEDGMPSDIGKTPEQGKKLAEKMNKAWEEVASSPEAREQLEADAQLQEDRNPQMKGGFDMGGRDEGKSDSDQIQAIKLAALAAKGRVVEIIDRIGRSLDMRVESTVVPSIEFKDDYDGKDTYVRDIKGPEEIPFLTPAEKAMAVTAPHLFGLRIVQGDAQVAPRATKLTRKQLIVMVVDRSGSMFDESDPNERWAYRVALGILMNRIKYANKGDAEVHFAFFADHLGDFHVVDREHPMSVSEVAMLMATDDVGGGTNIPEAVLETTKYIRKKFSDDKHTAVPEFVFVTDGRCSVTTYLIDPKTYMVDEKSHIKLNLFAIRPTLNFRVDPVKMQKTAMALWSAKSMRWFAEQHNDLYRDLTGTDSTYALSIVAKMTGGGAWYLKPSTGELLDPKDIYREVNPIYTHNPYKTWGFGNWTPPAWVGGKR